MQDFNSIYSDYQEAFNLGQNAGVEEAKAQTQDQLVKQGRIFAKQFGTELAMYEVFFKDFEQTANQDKEKSVKKLHSSVIQQKVTQLKEKIYNLVQKYLQSQKSLFELDYSVEYLQIDRKDIRSKFQTILSILGMKDYQKNALKALQQVQSTNLQENSQIKQQEDEQALQF